MTVTIAAFRAMRVMAGRLYSRLGAFVVGRRWWVLGVYALITLVLGWLGARIELRSDITDLLPVGTPSADDLRLYLDRFGNTSALFVTLTAPGDDPDPLELEEPAESLAAKLSATGLVRGVRYGWSDEEGLELHRRMMAHLPVLLPGSSAGELRRRLSPGHVRASLERIRAAATGPLMAGPRKTLAAEDPLGLLDLIAGSPADAGPIGPDPGTGLLLSPDGRTLLMVATPVKPPQDVPFSKELLAAVERAAAQVREEHPGVAIEHAGGHLFAVQDEARIRHDITWTASIAMTAIVTLFALVLRRLSLLMMLIVPLSLSTLWTLGIASMHPGHLNVVTVAFAAILLGMGDDSLTHLYLRFRELTAAGTPRRGAIAGALASTGPSIMVATLTSGLAFAALAFVEFRGLAELGIVAAIGLLSLLVSVFFLFPALLSFGGEGGPGIALPMEPFVRFHRWAARRRPLILGCAAVVAVAAGAACFRLEYSSDIRALRGDDPAQERLDRVMAPFGGMPDPIGLMRPAAGREEALRQAESLDPLCAALRERGAVTGCTSPAGWTPSERKQRERFEAAGDIRWRETAAQLSAEADRLGLNVSWFAPFLRHLERYGEWEEVRLRPDGASSPGDPMAPPAARDDLALVSLHPAAGRPAREIVDLARRLDPAAMSGWRAASVGLVVADLSAVIERDFRRASLLALAAVVLTALAAFRSVSMLILAGLPVLLGCLLMLGGLAMLGIPINLMNLVATPLVFGLGIDFGVYIVNRHEEEGRGDVETVLRHTGGAILLTGLTTLAGFGSLLTAGFAGLRSMGWVALLGIAGCLLSALLVLPLILPARSR